jgi:hypothetical protein
MESLFRMYVIIDYNPSENAFNKKGSQKERLSNEMTEELTSIVPVFFLVGGLV